MIPYWRWMRWIVPVAAVVFTSCGDDGATAEVEALRSAVTALEARLARLEASTAAPVPPGLASLPAEPFPGGAAGCLTRAVEALRTAQLFAKLDALIADFKPVLPTRAAGTGDRFACLTTAMRETPKVKAAMAAAKAAAKRDIMDAAKARAEAAAEFKNTAALHFRWDPAWESRRIPATYGCWVEENQQIVVGSVAGTPVYSDSFSASKSWTTTSFNEAECAHLDEGGKKGLRPREHYSATWKLRNPASSYYGRLATDGVSAARPELMKRVDAAKVELGGPLACVVDDVKARDSGLEVSCQHPEGLPAYVFVLPDRAVEDANVGDLVVVSAYGLIKKDTSIGTWVVAEIAAGKPSSIAERSTCCGTTP